jgi:hypothetical protein
VTIGGVVGGYYLYSQLKGFNAGDVTATILGMLGGAGGAVKQLTSLILESIALML